MVFLFFKIDVFNIFFFLFLKNFDLCWNILFKWMLWFIIRLEKLRDKNSYWSLVCWKCLVNRSRWILVRINRIYRRKKICYIFRIDVKNNEVCKRMLFIYYWYLLFLFKLCSYFFRIWLYLCLVRIFLCYNFSGKRLSYWFFLLVFWW